MCPQTDDLLKGCVPLTKLQKVSRIQKLYSTEVTNDLHYNILKNSKNHQSDFDLWCLQHGFGSWRHSTLRLDKRLHPHHSLPFLSFTSSRHKLGLLEISASFLPCSLLHLVLGLFHSGISCSSLCSHFMSSHVFICTFLFNKKLLRKKSICKYLTFLTMNTDMYSYVFIALKSFHLTFEIVV